VLLEDGRTLVCVYPKGHGQGGIVVMGFCEPIRTGDGQYRLRLMDNTRGSDCAYPEGRGAAGRYHCDDDLRPLDRW